MVRSVFSAYRMLTENKLTRIPAIFDYYWKKTGSISVFVEQTHKIFSGENIVRETTWNWDCDLPEERKKQCKNTHLCIERSKQKIHSSHALQYIVVQILRTKTHKSKGKIFRLSISFVSELYVCLLAQRIYRKKNYMVFGWLSNVSFGGEFDKGESVNRKKINRK